VPDSDPCRKYNTHNPCCDCNTVGHTDYEPKTPAGEGREILIDDQWWNPVTGEREYFPLRDIVESYFALSGTHAPDDEQIKFGHDMIDGDGISEATLNEWIRDVGAQAKISRQERADWLRQHIEIEDPDDDDNDRQLEQIIDFGRDRNGNEIPDFISHDLRASFCTQLMRPVTDASRQDAILLTGHETPASMTTYLEFANDEISSETETLMY
jgi:hypothetical protein